MITFLIVVAWFTAGAHADGVPAVPAVDSLSAGATALGAAAMTVPPVSIVTTDHSLASVLYPAASASLGLLPSMTSPAGSSTSGGRIAPSSSLGKIPDVAATEAGVNHDGHSDTSDRPADSRVAAPGDLEKAKRDPLSTLTAQDKAILAAAAERIVQKAFPWLDLKLLRKLEIFQTLQFQNMHVNWDVHQKPGVGLGSSQPGVSPISLTMKASTDLVPGMWQASWVMVHPLDGHPVLGDGLNGDGRSSRPVMQVKSQFWFHTRFHADVGYQFLAGDRPRDVLRNEPAATMGWRIGIYDFSYSYANGQHQLALGTLF